MDKKVILITGASSGIGKSCAEALVKDGHTVYGTSRKTQSNAENTIKYIQCDVTNRESVKSCVKDIISKEGRIDVLLNNAGAGVVGALELTTIEEYSFQMKVNLEGVVNMCCEVIPFMREKKNGTIINISSVGGIMGLPFQGLYSASKFAIEGYSEALRLELYPFNLRVVLIEPGDFNTGFTSSRMVSKATEWSSDYKEQFEITRQILENNEQSGSNPIKIGKLVSKIVNSNSRRFRYPVGNIIERLSIIVKRFVPGRFYQWILRQFYQVKRKK